MPIRGFKDKMTAELFAGKFPKGFPPKLVRPARRRLRAVHEAAALHDLKGEGNKLHKLEHDKAGRLAIKVNDNWRVSFIWKDGEPWDVVVEDYH